MTRFVALLRGINVGGKNKLPMADLRAALEGAGYHDVQTYIQSGNVALSGPTCHSGEISALIDEQFGLTVPVVVRTASQLRATIDGNPFPEAETEPKRLLVYFCSGPAALEALQTFDHDKYRPDRLAARPPKADGPAEPDGPSELYVAYDVGLSASKLTNAVLDRTFELSTTARNWNTVLKLAEMAESD